MVSTGDPSRMSPAFPPRLNWLSSLSYHPSTVVTHQNTNQVILTFVVHLRIPHKT